MRRSEPLGPPAQGQPVIRWTESRQVIERPTTEAETLQATSTAVTMQICLRDHRLLRKRVSEVLDLEEAQIARKLDDALRSVARKAVGVAARIGYDLEAGETVFADPETGEEMRRQPITEHERRIALQMPAPTA